MHYDTRQLSSWTHLALFLLHPSLLRHDTVPITQTSMVAECSYAYLGKLSCHHVTVPPVEGGLIMDWSTGCTTFLGSAQFFIAYSTQSDKSWTKAWEQVNEPYSLEVVPHATQALENSKRTWVQVRSYGTVLCSCFRAHRERQ